MVCHCRTSYIEQAATNCQIPKDHLGYQDSPQDLSIQIDISTTTTTVTPSWWAVADILPMPGLAILFCFQCIRGYLSIFRFLNISGIIIIFIIY